MKIWIDGYEANVPDRLGSSKVAYELIKQLEKLDHKNEYTILLPNHPMDDFPKERPGFNYKILHPKRFWSAFALPLALFTAKVKPNLIFSPTHYIPRFSPVKRVGTIFDLSFLYFPKYFQKRDLWRLKSGTKFSVQNSNKIITISNSSKQDIVKSYGIEKNKIVVAYPGYDSESFYILSDQVRIQTIKDKYRIIGNYVIFVGTIQPRKNIIRLIEVFQKIDNLKLVIVGKTSGLGRSGWMYENILKKPKELGIEDRIIFTGFVSNEDLNLLLNGASAFVLASLWEGFGIPVVDAMAVGLPVIVSNVSSLPEVVGEAGLLVDPESSSQIEQAIRTITTDKKLAAKKSKQALAQSAKFSWDKMAKVVLKTLEEVGSE
ncbi:MAG: glycosyltransferase family 1 protein [Candidatus Daviesbacteria bacterium]|nr:glycosyltransferase family 1 protein [Candidatus Daviesbacteria bacterium]